MSIVTFANIGTATSSFSFSFNYLASTDIDAFVDGVSVFANNASTGTAVGGNTFTVAFSSTGSKTLTFSPAVPQGSTVRIERNTDLTTKVVDFSDGAVLTELALDSAIDQVFFGVQESNDKTAESITVATDGKWDAQSKVIKNVTNPVNAQDAVTKNYLENTWLSTSDKTQLNSLNTTHLSTVATNVTNVNTVASNISDVNAFAQVYRSGASDPTTSLDEGDLFYNTTSNLLKIWDGSAWGTGVAGVTGLMPLAGGTMTGNIAFSGTQTVDGRDVSVDGTKLDGIEAGANVTDAANVVASLTAGSNITIASDGTISSTASGNGDLVAANNLSDLDNAGTARTNLGVAIGSNVQAHSSVLDATTASFTTAKDSKLTGIEASANVTDAANVTAAGALMDSEVTNLAQVKAFSASDYATAAQGTLATNALPKSGGTMTGDIDGNGNKVLFGNVYTALSDLPNASTYHGMFAHVHNEGKAYYAHGGNWIPLANASQLATVGDGGLSEINFTSADHTKLNGIEASATADQTAAEIRTLVESATDSNVFTDADHTKLNNTITSALYAENPVSSTAPIATGNNATAIGSGAKATGLEAFVLGEGLASHPNSIAMAISNNSTSYGATADRAISIGYLSRAVGAGSLCISGGASCEAIATSSAAIGGEYNKSEGYAAYTCGSNNVATGNYSSVLGGRNCQTVYAAVSSVATGYEAKATIVGQSVHSSGFFATKGDAQGSKFILRADTTDATATVLTTNNSTVSTDNQIVAASDTCIMFSGTLVAMQNGAQDQGGWEIKGLLKNDGGTTTLVSSNIQTFENGNGWVVALSADNTNNALAITCTGEASHNIRWVANIKTSEVTYA